PQVRPTRRVQFGAPFGGSPSLPQFDPAPGVYERANCCVHCFDLSIVSDSSMGTYQNGLYPYCANLGGPLAMGAGTEKTAAFLLSTVGLVECASAFMGKRKPF